MKFIIFIIFTFLSVSVFSSHPIIGQLKMINVAIQEYRNLFNTNRKIFNISILKQIKFDTETGLLIFTGTSLPGTNKPVVNCEARFYFKLKVLSSSKFVVVATPYKVDRAEVNCSK